MRGGGFFVKGSSVDARGQEGKKYMLLWEEREADVKLRGGKGGWEGEKRGGGKNRPDFRKQLRDKEIKGALRKTNLEPARCAEKDVWSLSWGTGSI